MKGSTQIALALVLVGIIGAGAYAVLNRYTIDHSGGMTARLDRLTGAVDLYGKDGGRITGYLDDMSGYYDIVKEQVDVIVAYKEPGCSSDFPVYVEVRNNSGHAILDYDFAIDVREKGHSRSLVNPFGNKKTLEEVSGSANRYFNDAIIADGASSHFCYAMPPLHKNKVSDIEVAVYDMEFTFADVPTPLKKKTVSRFSTIK